MSRIQRRGHGRAEIDVAQAHHQVAGVEDRLADRVDVGQVVDATDEFKVARAPWGILAHGGHVFVDGELAGRIVPGQRQVHDAGGHAQVAGGADARPLRRDVLQQHRQRQLARAIVDLQRADAGRQVDDAIDILRLQGLHEGVRPEARDEVQFGRAHFEQQMGVARQAGHQALVAGARVEHDRRGRGRGLPVLLVRGQRRAFLVARIGQAAGRGQIHRNELHAVARLELAELPQVRLDDRHRAHKTAQARTIGSQDHRHVPVKSTAPRHTGCRGC